MHGISGGETHQSSVARDRFPEFLRSVVYVVAVFVTVRVCSVTVKQIILILELDKKKLS